jgi:hypothetical protein
MNEVTLSQAKILIQRLERLSADSYWAHHASGLRASLEKHITQVDNGKEDDHQIEMLIQEGFKILENAAREIPDRDED